MKKGSTATQEECSNCAASLGADGSALKKCSKCKQVSYCSQACQLQHWRDGGHKRFCLTPEERAKPSTPVLAEDPKRNTRKCAICGDELIPANEIAIPCGHSFHKQCLTSLRDFGVSQACPLSPSRDAGVWASGSRRRAHTKRATLPLTVVDPAPAASKGAPRCRAAQAVRLSGPTPPATRAPQARGCPAPRRRSAGPEHASAECAPEASPRARSQPRCWVGVGSGGARGYL